MIVLAWIQQEARSFKTFVSNRIGEIQMKSNAKDWRYCPSELNVADDVSRSRTADELNERWRHSPKFLRLSESEWLVKETTIDSLDLNKINTERQASCVVANSVHASVLAEMNKFSTLPRAIRVTATVM
jgi:hypothetical protein